MASQSSTNVGWRRALRSTAGLATSGAIAIGLLVGAGASTANADVLDDINAQYDTGAGGGQISNLIHDAMRLRSQGFVPSKGNMIDLQDGWTKRPNQGPLVSALEETVAYMRRSQMRAASQGSQQAPAIGIGGTGNGVPNPNGGGGINIPLNP